MNRKRKNFDDSFNLWNNNFDEIFKAFQDEMRSFMNRNSSEYQDNDPITYGYSIRIGPDTQYRPEIRQWGNLNDFRRKKGLPEIELPFKEFKNSLLSEGTTSDDAYVDFIEEDEQLKIIVEVPGFNIDSLKIDIDEDGSEIKLYGKTESKEINKVILLPSKIEPNSTKSSLKNGVLEIRGKKKKNFQKRINLKID